MKNLKNILALVVIFGSVSLCFAGNRPAVTYPEGSLNPSNSSASVDVITPWHKGVNHYSIGVVSTGVWYRTCPVMTNVVLNSKHESEVVLSNGKKIMLSWAGLKDVVEKDLPKYTSYMY